MPEDFSMEVPRLARDRKEAKEIVYHKLFSKKVYFKPTMQKEYEAIWDLERREYTHEAI